VFGAGAGKEFLSVQKRGFKETSAKKAVDCEADGMVAQAPAMPCLLFGQHIRTLLVMGSGRGKTADKCRENFTLGWTYFIRCGELLEVFSLWQRCTSC
jgi:hypothetical protein